MDSENNHITTSLVSFKTFNPYSFGARELTKLTKSVYGTFKNRVKLWDE